jgi:hypothetical protein
MGVFTTNCRDLGMVKIPYREYPTPFESPSSHGCTIKPPFSSLFMAGPRTSTEKIELICMDPFTRTLAFCTSKSNIHTLLIAGVFISSEETVSTSASPMPLQNKGGNFSIVLNTEEDMSHIQLIDTVLQKLQAARSAFLEWTHQTRTFVQEQRDTHESGFVDGPPAH